MKVDENRLLALDNADVCSLLTPKKHLKADENKSVPCFKPAEIYRKSTIYESLFNW